MKTIEVLMNHYDKIKTAEQDIVNRTASYNIAHWIVRPLINSLDKIAKEVLTDQEFQEYLKERLSSVR